MSFEYGSDSPEIKNPFKQEGLLYCCSGLLIGLIGLVSLFTLRGRILEQGLQAGWLHLSVSLILLTGGVALITQGLLKVFRFYVGRNIPADLSSVPTKSGPGSHRRDPSATYTADELDEMVNGRKNTTFREPTALLDRMLYSLVPELLFLPHVQRAYLHVLLTNIGYSLIGLSVYLLALLSGSVGLTLLTSSSFTSWMGLVLSAALLAPWLLNPLSLSRIHDKGRARRSQKGLILGAAGAILLPAAAELALRQGLTLPEAPLNPLPQLVVFFILLTAAAAIALMMGRHRAGLLNPLTEVSEFRDDWQESVHPKDFFRSFDMEMANLRYKEFPNRVYRDLSPQLTMEGSLNKGSFSGDTIQETQPVHVEIAHSPWFRKLRLAAAAVGHGMLVLSALILMGTSVGWTVGGELTLAGVYGSAYYSVLLWLFGRAAITLTHLYWGEIHFKSYLIQFRGEGTYTESTYKVGTSITDSTGTQTPVIRSSISPWLQVTALLTSTQAESGLGNLSGPRWILSMEKADEILYYLVGHIRIFLEQRETIAAPSSAKDMDAIERIMTLNEAAASRDRLGKLEQELRRSQSLQSRPGERDEEQS